MSSDKYFVRPGSDTILLMNGIKLNELSSCEVQGLNQFRTADLIWIGSAGSKGCGSALIKTAYFT